MLFFQQKGHNHLKCNYSSITCSFMPKALVRSNRNVLQFLVVSFIGPVSNPLLGVRALFLFSIPLCLAPVLFSSYFSASSSNTKLITQVLMPRTNGTCLQLQVMSHHTQDQFYTCELDKLCT